MKKLYVHILLSAFLVSSCSVIQFTSSGKLEQIEFTEDPANENYQFIYQDDENSPELSTLQSLYRLDSVADMGSSEIQRMLALLNWTNGRWKHNGSNTPSKSNTLTILEEAKAGKKFRCVEYGTVLRSVLAANGYKARTLGLKIKEVEVTSSGAGHVPTEAWSDTHGKWFLLDAQFNVVPMLDGQPLNAVELQDAIFQKKDFKLVNFYGEVDNMTRKNFLRFIPSYLYYFDFRFDQREVVYDSLYKVNNKIVLMLVPKGAKRPDTFQIKNKMNYLEYTNSLNDFYRKPE